MRNDCVQRTNSVGSLWTIDRCKEGYRIERQNSRTNITILKKTSVKFSQSDKTLQEAVEKTDRKR